MPSLKKSHHYVPQFWMRGFANSNNQLYAWDGSAIRTIAAKNIMQEPWLYTIFNWQWEPSDVLENGLSTLEGEVAPIFKALTNPAYVASFDDRQLLSLFLGVQAARHPDVLGLGHRRGKDLATLLASTHEFSDISEFATRLRSFGVSHAAAAAMYKYLKTVPVEQLQQQATEIQAMSPQDPGLPIQDALRAYEIIANVILNMDWCILDAPVGLHFVLGDTPMPQDSLAKGFVIPLSKSVALTTTPPSGVKNSISRRQATSGETRVANRMQWENAKNIVIGPDAATLQSV